MIDLLKASNSELVDIYYCRLGTIEQQNKLQHIVDVFVVFAIKCLRKYHVFPSKYLTDIVREYDMGKYRDCEHELIRKAI